MYNSKVINVKLLFCDKHVLTDKKYFTIKKQENFVNLPWFQRREVIGCRLTWRPMDTADSRVPPACSIAHCRAADSQWHMLYHQKVLILT